MFTKIFILFLIFNINTLATTVHNYSLLKEGKKDIGNFSFSKSYQSIHLKLKTRKQIDEGEETPFPFNEFIDAIKSSRKDLKSININLSEMLYFGPLVEDYSIVSKEERNHKLNENKEIIRQKQINRLQAFKDALQEIALTSFRFSGARDIDLKILETILAEMKTLKLINFTQSPELTDTGAETISRIVASIIGLEELDVGHTQITESGAEDILIALLDFVDRSSFKALALGFNNIHFDDGLVIGYIEKLIDNKCPNLVALNMRGNGKRSLPSDYLEKFKKLKELIESKRGTIRLYNPYGWWVFDPAEPNPQINLDEYGEGIGKRIMY